MTAEGPRFEATPQNPDLLRWIGIQVLLLVIAWVIGMVVRRLLASRMTISTASATLTGLGGLWGQRLGTNAAALPILDFAEASDPQEGYERQEVCRVTIPPALGPVYLRGPKGKGEAELWVHVGNSTRRLEVADAVQYVAARWPETVRVSPLTRARLFFTLRRHRDTPTRLPRVVERVLTERAKHGVGSSEGE